MQSAASADASLEGTFEQAAPTNADAATPTVSKVVLSVPCHILFLGACLCFFPVVQLIRDGSVSNKLNKP